MKKSYLNHRGLVIKKSKLTDIELNKIKEKLQVRPYLGDFDDNNEQETFKVFHETKKKLIVPRYWGIKKYGTPKKQKFTGETRKFNFIGEMRDYQIDIVNICYEKILQKGGGLLSVGCGRGKTVMAINLAYKLQAKTLVVVHKTFLQDQWVERIKQFTDAKIGIIRQDIIDVEDKDFVIAMIQSVSMKDYDLKIFDKFKFVIYDEAHHCASKIFSQSLYKTGANYTLALSATPERQDGLKKVMDWFLGPTLYREHRKPNKQVLAKIFKYTTKDKLFVEKKIFRAGQSKPHIPKMTNNLVEIKERNNHLINIINQLRKYPERKILVLSGRREHLKLLKDTVDVFIKREIDNNNIEVGETKTYYYLGGMKEKERKNAELNADILFATYDMAHEGLDIDRLNTVILATPKKNIIQSVGRIMRRILKTGDIKPIIIDWADMLSSFKYQSEKRLNDYNDSKYKIDIYYVDGSKFLSQRDYLINIMNFTEDEIKGYLNEKDLIVPKLETILDDDNDDNKVNLEKDNNHNNDIENLIYGNKKIDYTEYLF